MKYIQAKEENLAFAMERVEEAVQSLVEVLPDTAAELGWILLGMQDELFETRNTAMQMADEGEDFDL